MKPHPTQPLVEVDDDFARSHGFQSLSEMLRMIASAEISTPEKMAAFKRWQEDDGSREGLDGLAKINETAEGA